jgi:hypothetical protein
LVTSSRVKQSEFLTPKKVAISCLETSVSIYDSTPHNIPEEPRPRTDFTCCMFFVTVTRMDGWMELHACFLINQEEGPRFKENRTCEIGQASFKTNGRINGHTHTHTHTHTQPSLLEKLYKFRNTKEKSNIPGVAERPGFWQQK